MEDSSEVELDDPYLELFDRINQLEMDLKEMKDRLVRNNVPGFVTVATKIFPNNNQYGFKFFE